MAKAIGIIPARYGSIRFPGKPLAPIMGKTLLQRTYENTLQSSHLDLVIVATDDQRIYDHVEAFGGRAVMTSSAHPTGTDRLVEVLKRMPELMQADIIVNIQGDEPCVSPLTLQAIIQALRDDPSADMSTAITPITCEEEAYSSSIVKCVTDRSQYAIYFSRALIPSNKAGRYDPLQRYYRHIGIYAYRPQFLLAYTQLPISPLQQAEDLEQLKVIEQGYRIKTALVNEISIGVDTPEDIIKIESLLCKQNTSSLPGASVRRSEKV